MTLTVDAPVTDVLGEPYTARTIHLPPDSADTPAAATLAGRPGAAPVELVATLVHRPAATASGPAVLYVHGWCDYFFQHELADFHIARGEHFYALDLRRYGRSIRPGQVPFDIADLADYRQELEQALTLIAGDGNGPVIVMAHSTGCLITADWLAARPGGPGPVKALIHNSPFLAMPVHPVLAASLTPLVRTVGPWRPLTVLPVPAVDVYGESLLASRHGEWDYNVDWKPATPPPIRFGWLSAIQHAQQRMRAGAGIPVPILTLTSARSATPKVWGPEAATSDIVLNSDRISELATRLGPMVTVLRLDGALHDVLLSARPVREKAYRLIAEWLDSYAPLLRAEADTTGT